MKQKSLLGSLTAADIALTAGLSVIIGVLFTFWSNIVAVIVQPLGSFGIPFIYGFWFLGGIIPAYIIRKPGVALLGEFLAAHVELLTGSQYGLLLTYYGVTQGLACELVFAAFGYKRWDLLALGLAGAAAALPAYVMDYISYAYGTFSIALRAAFLGVMALSGAIFSGLGKFVADAVANTGLLANFAINEKSS